MASCAANGTDISFGTTLTQVVSVKLAINGNPIDVTDLDSTAKEFIAGTEGWECTIEQNGATALTIHSTGSLTVSWNDGGTSTMGNALISAVDISATEGDALKSSVTFVPLGDCS